ncbi:MAG: hypothetical protein GY765_02845 [bacterium]|nr:hypothetical protein [bacterium]
MSKNIVEYGIKVDTKTGKVEIQNVNDEFDNLGKSGERGAKKASKAFGSLRSDMAQLNQALEFCKKAFDAISGPIIDVVNIASDARESSSKFLAVFKEEGPAATEWIDKFSDDVNRSDTAVQEWMSTFQDTFVPLGFARDEARELSQKLTRLTVDMSSFYNEAESEVLAGVQSALVGNHETMRKYSVIINQTALHQELLNMKVAGGIKNATEQQKVLARLNLIIAGTGDAQGDAARTALEWANQVRGFNAIFQKVKESVGDAIITELLPVLQEVNTWLKDNKAEVLEYAKALGSGIADFITGIIDTGKYLYEHRETLILIAKLVAAAFAAKWVNSFAVSISAAVTKMGGMAALTGTLTGGVGGLKGAVGKLGTAAAAAFVGWEIGGLINDTLGLQEATAALYKEEMKLAVLRSEHRNGLSDHAKDNREVVESIKAMGAELGVTSIILSTHAKRIFANKEAYGKLSPEQKRIVDGFVRSKKAVEEHTRKLEANRQKEAALLKAKEASRKAWEEQRKAIMACALELGFFTEGRISELIKRTEIVTATVKYFESQLNVNQEAIEKTGAEVATLIQHYKNLGRDVPENLDLIRIKTDFLNENNIDWEEGIEKIGMVADREFAKMADAVDGATEATLDQADAQELAKQKVWNTSDAIEDISEDMQAYGAIIGQVGGLLGKMGILGESAVDTLSGVGQGVAAIGQNLGKWNSDDAGFFDKISAGLGMISGALSIATSLFGGLFSSEPDWEGQAESWTSGIDSMTDRMQRQLAETAEEMESVKDAWNSLLDDFILESAGTSRAAFSEWTLEVIKLFGVVKSGGADMSDLENAITSLIDVGAGMGVMGERFTVLLNMAKKSGMNIGVLTQYITDTMNTGISGLITNMEYFGATNQETFDSSLAAAMMYYNGLIENGASMTDAFSQMDGLFDALRNTLTDGGFEMTAAFQDVFDLQEKVAANEALLKAIDGWNQGLLGLANTGLLQTQEQFDVFLSQSTANFDQLIAAGFDEAEALQMLAPYLANLISMQNEYGVEIDAGTQKYIDQAIEAGISLEKQISPQERMIEILEQILAAMDSVGLAAGDAAKRVGDSFGEMDEETGIFADSVDEVVKNVLQIGEAIEGVDETWKNAVTGNTIVAENEKWLESLAAIDDEIWKIGDTVRIGDREYTLLMRNIDEATREGWLQALEAIENKMLALPDDMEVLLDQYQWTLSMMEQANDDYYLGLDGVVRTLTDVLALQGQIEAGEGTGGRYGYYSDEEKQENYVEFKRLGHIWEAQRDSILSSPEGMGNFLRDLENIEMVTDDEQWQYERFLASMRQWAAHVENGDSWNGSGWDDTEAPAAEARRAYSPAADTAPPLARQASPLHDTFMIPPLPKPTSGPGGCSCPTLPPIKIDLPEPKIIEKGDTYIINNYFPEGCKEIDKAGLVKVLDEVFTDNYKGFKTKVINHVVKK